MAATLTHRILHLKSSENSNVNSAEVRDETNSCSKLLLKMDEAHDEAGGAEHEGTALFFLSSIPFYTTHNFTFPSSPII